jgi:16S rRNA (adenine1518-N6/adenine1519-N6)-dimethyltransferase
MSVKRSEKTDMTLHQQVREFFNRTGRRPKKRLGQHFLIDPNVLHEIVEAAQLTDADLVLEIGAGLGFLTDVLAVHAKKVVAVELDAVLFTELERKFCVESSRHPQGSDSPYVTLIQADILKQELSPLLCNFPVKQTKVIANLPYYITTPVLWKLLEHHQQLGTCVLMMQMEVAERIVASPGGKDYGSLSIGVCYYAEAEIIQTLHPHQFYPSPQVHSALLRLKLRDVPPVTVENEKLFFRIVRAAFATRRKMLRNALLRSDVSIDRDVLEASFNQLAIDPRRRGETLSIAEFATLANALNKEIGN